MGRQHTIFKLVFILFMHIIQRTSGAEDCFPNEDEIDGFCQCSDFRSNTPNATADSIVSCSIREVSSDHIFWDKFSQITGSPKTITVTIMDFKISYFPLNFFLNLPASIQEVKLKDWNFESIPKIPVAKVSEKISSLTTLEINDNEKLTTISPFAFASLNSLTRLVLSSNSLSNLTAFSLYNLIKLRDLMLNQNKIVSLPDGIFKSLEGLGNLSIAQNEIALIKRETFVGLSSLQDLDLNRNKLLIIKNDTFHGMKKLRGLDLSHNEIDTIEQAAFRGLVALDHLDLSHNQLRYLPNGAFKYSDSMSTLDLKNNELKRLDFDLFKQLPKFAYLKDNPWICDCSLFIYIDKIVNWNKETRCDIDVDFNRYRRPVKQSSMTFSEYAEEIAENPVKMEKCKELNKTIEKRSHKVAANYNAKFINSSGSQLMPFMNFIFLMLLLPGLDN